MNLHDLAQYSPCYLCSPYSKRADLDQASEEVCEVAGRLLAAGVMVLSPIAHAHAIAMASSRVDPLDHKLWMRLDEALAPICRAAIVVEMDGWQESDGIAKELKWFATRPVYYLNPKTMELRT